MVFAFAPLEWRAALRGGISMNNDIDSTRVGSLKARIAYRFVLGERFRAWRHMTSPSSNNLREIIWLEGAIGLKDLARKNTLRGPFLEGWIALRGNHTKAAAPSHGVIAACQEPALWWANSISVHTPPAIGKVGGGNTPRDHCKAIP